MSLDKYATAGERRKATALVDALLAQGYRLSVNNGGDENEIPFITDRAAILNTLAAAEIDEIIVHIGSTYMGFARLTYGNDPDGSEVIQDYSVTLSHVIDPLIG